MKKLPLFLLLFTVACGKKDPTPAAVPAFTTSRTVVETRESISVNNTTANAASYSWRTDDGQTATGPTPSFAFATTGTHTITLTALNSAGDAATVDHTVTVGTRFFKSLEVVALPNYLGIINLRVEYGLASAAPARPYATPYRSNVQQQSLPLTYTDAYLNLSTLFAMRDLPVTKAAWVVAPQRIDSGVPTTLETLTLDLTAPSANRDQAGAGSYEFVNVRGDYKIRMYYETRIP